MSTEARPAADGAERPPDGEPPAADERVPGDARAAGDGRPAEDRPVTAELADAVWALIGAARRAKARRGPESGGPGSSAVRVLGQLVAHDAPASMGTIGRGAGLNPASTSAVVDRLEADGLVTRTRDADDRRVVLVGLTEQGRVAVDRRVAAWQAEWADDLAALPEDDLAVTTRTLRRIAAAIDAR